MTENRSFVVLTIVFTAFALLTLFLLFESDQRVGMAMTVKPLNMKNSNRLTGLRTVGANKNSRRLVYFDDEEKED